MIDILRLNPLNSHYGWYRKGASPSQLLLTLSVQSWGCSQTIEKAEDGLTEEETKVAKEDMTQAQMWRSKR